MRRSSGRESGTREPATVLRCRLARNLIADAQNTIWVRVEHVGNPAASLGVPSDFEERLARESFESLPLTAAHTREVALLPWHHRDPFDRMLIAQARAADLVFVTADEIAAAYGDQIVVVR